MCRPIDHAALRLEELKQFNLSFRQAEMVKIIKKPEEDRACSGKS